MDEGDVMFVLYTGSVITGCGEFRITRPAF